MIQERIDNYNSHATLLADIALAILNNNKNVLNINGVKEIIALYLLIPYMTPATLKTPDKKCIIPKINGEFLPGVSFSDLRDTISHFFITVEEDKNDGTKHGKMLIFDDRICTDRKEHSKKDFHGGCNEVPIKYVHNKLLEEISQIVKSENVSCKR